MDLIIRNAKIRRQENLVDIGIKDGKFIEINEKIHAKASKEINANGYLLTSPFVESHIHLDSALSAGVPRYNESGTLLEGIEIWGERKRTLTKEDIKKNAIETIKWQIANGVLRIRTHSDVTEPSLMTLEAILEVKEEMKEYVDIQIVAFPQDGIFSIKDMDKQIEKALKMGADVVGGIPQVELTREDGIKSIEYIFNLANKYNKLIDIHTDETSDDQSRFIEVIAKHTISSGMEGLVTASHATAMHNYNNDYASKIIGILKRADVNIVTNPFSNTVLQNRLDGYPRRRGHTRVDELIDRGVNVSIGNDNIMDPFGPLGKGNMLQAAHLLLHTAHLSGNEQILKLFDMITVNGAKTINEEEYDIKVGNQADCLILDARDEKESIRLTSECLYVIRKGKVISETKPAKRLLKLDQDTFDIDFKI
ncbi:cytosine deaminase CodA [Gottschalkia acidurici 9a]|uniref:Cytosine deaminase CodA n=1 Tax=Gottschalkia acidurici (strain ATCC 7906 / DSM 604 / BCRC 14475 / CIP 104303 / KCTC 5404 / NCIMB 10678 / 9a) TaxID=1128398 RepID=K0AWL5_GOTA9|nr:cytosine deaminase [Gottschalkia acidurici]AFS77629.1 cytosine deaminase CodA [Gottschalkia acidurici 9a]